MDDPRPPHRPQAVRLRFASRRRLVQGGRPVTWLWCLAALVLLAVAGAIGHSSAAASILPQAPGRAVEGAARAREVSRAAPESAGDAWSEARAVALQGAGPSPGPPAGPSRRLVVQLTAYSASLEEGTAWGITRVGTRVRQGVVAVDPAVIPLGSRLRIEGLAGIYRAEDTGGGIRGAHIDIFMESRSAALQFGRRGAVVAEVLD